jgi:hypothetical protein
MSQKHLIKGTSLVRTEIEKVADNVRSVEKQSGYVGQYTVKTDYFGINFEHYDGPLDFATMSVWEHDESIVFSLRVPVEGGD